MGNQILNQWGPALIVCFTLLMQIIYQNVRMADLRTAFDKRIDDLKRYIGAEVKALSADIRGLEKRVERLESPIVHK